MTITPQNLIRSKQRKGIFYFLQKKLLFQAHKKRKNPLAKQDRIEQDFDGRLYLIRKVSKSKDFSIDFGEGGRSRIQILQARIWRKIRKRLLLGCSIRFCLAKWSNMWSSLIFTATGICPCRAGRRNADELSRLFSAIIFGRFSRVRSVATE